MSITSAMNNALSGLTAASRGIEVVSSNVANARTAGYARREMQLASHALGGVGAGVKITGIQRVVDQGVLADLRLADADVASNDTRLAFRSSVGRLIGTAADGGALSDKVAAFRSALVEASNLPDNTGRLSAVLGTARDLVGQLNAASDGIQQSRMEADDAISQTVTRLNDNLVKVRDLNVAIRKLGSSGRDASALVDQRQVLIDDIASVVPVRELPRDNGMVALVTSGGAMLLDGSPATIGFAGVGFVTADMTIGSGALSGLTLNGKPVDITGGQGRLGGGSLGALFDVRDGLSVEAQAIVDSLARDVYERFADPALDPGITTGAPGLFTDAGAAFDPLAEAGLAGRLSINPTVDPAQGGALWRLRSGVYATAATNTGDGTLLTGMADALDTARSPASGPFGSGVRSAGSLAGEASALWSSGTKSLERTLAYSGARSDTLRSLHLQDGVDTDQEMQSLLSLEQAYGANAKVVATLDDLIQRLLSI